MSRVVRRAGRAAGRALPIFLAALAAAGVAGAVAYSRRPCSTSSCETSPAPQADSDVSSSVALACVNTRTLATGPILVQIKGTPGKRLPPSVAIAVDVPQGKVSTMTAGFEARKNRVVATAATIRFDRAGEVPVTVVVSEPASGIVRLFQGEREVGSEKVDWLPMPDEFVVLLPGQRLEGGKAVGEPTPATAGREYEVAIVPLKGGVETTFFAVFQAHVKVAGDQVEKIVDLNGGRATAKIVAPRSTAGEFHVEVTGLKTSAIRSSDFRVVAGGTPAKG